VTGLFSTAWKRDCDSRGRPDRRFDLLSPSPPKVPLVGTISADDNCC